MLYQLSLCGFIAQLVEHHTGIAEVTGSNPVEAMIYFFQASSFQLLKLENLLRWSHFAFKNSISLPLLWLPSHQFELDMWRWLLASFRVRDRKYLSIGLQRFEPTLRFSSSKYSTPWWIFARTELLALAGVESHVLVSQKRDWGKARFSSVV